MSMAEAVTKLAGRINYFLKCRYSTWRVIVSFSPSQGWQGFQCREGFWRYNLAGHAVPKDLDDDLDQVFDVSTTVPPLDQLVSDTCQL
ncbi:hypothetical protein N9248_01945 [bacterium]|nr:hypothetical protein [bacterium]